MACQHTWQRVCVNLVLSSMLSRLILTIQAQSLHGARKTLYQFPGSTRLGCDQTNTPPLLLSTSNKAEKQAEGSSMRLDLKKVHSLYPRESSKPDRSPATASGVSFLCPSSRSLLSRLNEISFLSRLFILVQAHDKLYFLFHLTVASRSWSADTR